MSITLRQTDEGDIYDSEQRKYILKRERNESQSEVEGRRSGSSQPNTFHVYKRNENGNCAVLVPSFTLFMAKN